MITLRISWAIFAGITIAYTANVRLLQGAEVDPSNQLWKEVVDGSAQEAKRIQNLQLSFETVEFLVGMDGVNPGPLGIKKSIFNVSAGECFREECLTERKDVVPPRGGDSRNFQIATFDGEYVRVRRSSLVGTICVGREKPTEKRHAPPLLNTLQFFRVGDLEGHRAAGREILRDASRVELDKKPMIKVKFETASTGYTQTMWYSTKQGYLLLRAEDANRNGVTEGLIEVEKTATILDRDGNTFFVPLAGYRKSLSGGRVVSQRQVKVDEASIHINDPIDRSWFALKRLKDEKVYDMDLMRDIGDAPGDAGIVENDHTTAVATPTTMPVRK